MIQQSIIEHGKQGELAAKRAFNKTLKWFQGQVATIATKEMGIPKKALKGRYFIDKTKHALWLGVNDLSVHRLGSARQNKQGVKVKDRQFDGAFIATMPEGHSLIMYRLGKERLPIEKVTVEVKDALEDAIQRVCRLVPDRFEVIYKQELNYVKNHEKPK